MDTDQFIEYGALRLWKLKSGQIDEGLERFRRSEFDGFSISRHFGYQEPNLDCLLQVPELKFLALSTAPKISLKSLERLPNLEWLSIDDNEEEIDFSRLPKLRLLMFSWNKKRTLPAEGLSRLEDLTIWRYPAADLFPLHTYQALTNLNVFQSRKLEGLQGIGGCASLRRAAFAYCSELKDVSDIRLLSLLTGLIFENCQKIDSYEPIQSAVRLRELEIRKSAPIANLKFLKPLLELEALTIRNTKINEDDLSVLDSFSNLTALQLDSKKGYRDYLDRLNRPRSSH